MLRSLQETQLIFTRNLRRAQRNPVWLWVAIFQPVLYLVLFAPLLDALRLPGYEQTDSLNVFAPGLLVMLTLFGGAYSGANILPDLHSGVLERLRVTPASRLALLLGMMLFDVVTVLAQSAVLIVVAVLMGLHADILGLLALFGLLALVNLIVVSASYGLALATREHDIVIALASTVAQPLLLLSGVLLPLTLAPAWMRTAAKANLFAYVVDDGRALVLGQGAELSLGPLVVVSLALATVLVLWTVRIFRRAAA